jgi:hypothetical protein
MTTPDELSSMETVTDLSLVGAPAVTDLDGAVQVADAAAQAAGVSVHALTDLADLSGWSRCYRTSGAGRRTRR